MRRPPIGATHPAAALLIGLDSMQGLQLARILADRGVRVTAIAADRSYHTVRTNSCERIVIGATHGDGLVSLLEELAPTFEVPPVVFPCQDHAVLTVSRSRDRLDRSFQIVLPGADVVEMMMDKKGFIGFAEAQGLRVPKTCFIRSTDDATRAAGELVYPVVLKPPIRTGAWLESAKAKVLRLEDPDGLIRAVDAHGHTAEVLIAQEWIPGTDADLYSLNAYYSSDSEPLATFVARKIRQWPIEAGQSSAGVECREDEVLRSADDAFRAAGMHGLAYMEFKKHSVTGEYFGIEPNIGRPTGRSAIAEAGGVELHYTMYCDALGLPLPASRTQTYGGAKWVHLLRDFLAARAYVRRGQLTYRKWLTSLRGPKSFALWSLRDPKPFLGAIGGVLRRPRGAAAERRRRSAGDA